MKILVAGWFSFEYGHATAGDLLARDLVCEWLDSAGVGYDVALDPPFQGGVDWRRADPAAYTHVVFVCGPFTRGEYEAEFLSRFFRSVLIGLDLSMQIPPTEWNPFDFLWERDSSEAANPDITFLGKRPCVPVIGVCLVEPYEGAWVDVANAAVRRLARSREAAVVEIDTRLDANATGLRTAAEVEALLAWDGRSRYDPAARDGAVTEERRASRRHRSRARWVENQASSREDWLAQSLRRGSDE